MYFRFLLAKKLASTNPRGQPHNMFVYGKRISKGEAPPGPPEINAANSDEMIAYNLRKTVSCYEMERYYTICPMYSILHNNICL